jgi:hypothetical protein
MEISMIPLKLKIDLLYDPAVPFLGIIAQGV